MARVTIDRDIERMARHLAGKHGARASEVVAERIRDLVKSGDRGAAEVWRQIADALRALEG
jgi:hypothetical protein